eukprot:6142400-Amphidinium_carterae.1
MSGRLLPEVSLYKCGGMVICFLVGSTLPSANNAVGSTFVHWSRYLLLLGAYGSKDICCVCQVLKSDFPANQELRYVKT